ncbi:MAG: hypothetical protein ABSB88_08980 [Bryobacteraceae bacterium]|jgi:hypothetical protein
MRAKPRPSPPNSLRETAGGNTLIFFSDCDGNILHLLHREHPLP